MHEGHTSVQRPLCARPGTFASAGILARCALMLSASVLLALGVSTAALPVAAAAQDAPAATAPADTIVELRLTDGSTFMGRIIAETDHRITFETVGGTRLELERNQIRSVTPVRGRVVDGEFWREDPNRTRLLVISPTGRALRAGEAYISAFWVAFPFLAYGITDSFTIAGGTPIVPGVIGRAFYLAPKLQVVRTPTVNASVGVLAAFVTEALSEGSVGIAYGVGTFGNTDQSVTAGAGWGFAVGGEDAWLSNEPLLMVGGEYRVGRTVKVLTENFFVLGESGSVITGGIRLFGERLSVDFGIGAFVERGASDVPWMPLLNFVYNF
jgi:hypothetical protein